MKRDLLIQANYRYNFDRDMYVNRSDKKAFSLEFVDDNPEDKIAKLIEADTDSSSWTFYFNTPPSEGVKQELAKLLG